MTETYKKIDTRTLRTKVMDAIKNHTYDEAIKVLDKISLELRRENSANISKSVSAYKVPKKK